MRKMGARALIRVAYDAALSVGLHPDKTDIQIEQSQVGTQRHYVLEIRTARKDGTNWGTRVRLRQNKSGFMSKASLSQFRWLVKQKSRWLKKGHRVKRQGFYDALWYTAAWMLNRHPYVRCWGVCDLGRMCDRALFVVWGSKEDPTMRVDKFTVFYDSFVKNRMETLDELVSVLRKSSTLVSAESELKGRTPLRPPKRP